MGAKRKTNQTFQHKGTFFDKLVDENSRLKTDFLLQRERTENILRGLVAITELFDKVSLIEEGDYRRIWWEEKLADIAVVLEEVDKIQMDNQKLVITAEHFLKEKELFKEKYKEEKQLNDNLLNSELIWKPLTTTHKHQEPLTKKNFQWKGMKVQAIT